MTKRERFVRVAQKRVTVVLNDLEILSHCSRNDLYEYTNEDIDKIINAIEEGVAELNKTFRGKKKFSLE